VSDRDEPALVAGVVIVPASMCPELLAALRESSRRPLGVSARPWSRRMACLTRAVEAGAQQYVTEQAHLRAGSGLTSKVVPGRAAPAPSESVLLGDMVGVAEAAVIAGVSARHIRALAGAGYFAGARQEQVQLPGDRASQLRWVLPRQAVEAYRSSRSDLDEHRDPGTARPEDGGPAPR
jgi:hypothetical protein